MPGKDRTSWVCDREKCGHTFPNHIHATPEGWVDWDDTHCVVYNCTCNKFKDVEAKPAAPAKTAAPAPKKATAKKATTKKAEPKKRILKKRGN